jgi:hypothetical protein
MALEKWEEPKTVTALRGFLGFTNYYSSYVPGYAELAADLMEKLKVNRGDGKKGSHVPKRFGEKERRAFSNIEQRLTENLKLQTVNPDKRFILRVDACPKKRCRLFCVPGSSPPSMFAAGLPVRRRPTLWSVRCKNGQVGLACRR